MVAAQKTRTRTNDPANTRSRVLDAAVGLFHRKGYAETSMQDIMDAAEVTSGALHHHYRSKRTWTGGHWRARRGDGRRGLARSGGAGA